MSPEEAREAYIKLSKMGSHYGPFVFYNEADWSEVEKIYDDIGKANEAIKALGNGVIEVASPWHAYFFVQSLLRTKLEKTNTYTKFLFRGQSSPEKPLATLYRRGVNRDSARGALELFKDFVDQSDLLDKEMLSEQNIVLMARHHGFATSHLDFTLDPSVALFLAGLGKNVDRYSRIFLISLNLILQWAKLYLPPVLAQRLYVQPGVFVDLPELHYPAFHGQLLELRFPREQSFIVYRDGKEIMMFPDNAYDHIIEALSVGAIGEQDYAETSVINPDKIARFLELSIKSADIIKMQRGDMDKIIKDRLDDSEWMKAALYPSRVWLSDDGPDLDIDREVTQAIYRDNRYTYEKLLGETDKAMKAARRYGPGAVKMQKKLFDQCLEVMIAAGGAKPRWWSTYWWRRIWRRYRRGT